MRQSQLPALPSFPDRQTQRKARLVPSVDDENIILWFSPLLRVDISAWWQKQIKVWGYEWEIVKEFHVSRSVKRFVQGTPIWCIFPCCAGQLILFWRFLTMTPCLGPKQAGGLQMPSSWSLLSHLLAGSRPEHMGLCYTYLLQGISVSDANFSSAFFPKTNLSAVYVVLDELFDMCLLITIFPGAEMELICLFLFLMHGMPLAFTQFNGYNCDPAFHSRFPGKEI